MKSIVNNDSIRNMRVYDRCIVPIEDKQASKPASKPASKQVSKQVNNQTNY